MKRTLSYLLCVAFLATVVPTFLNAHGGPESDPPQRLTTLFPGGDVLRPGIRSEGYTWYIGLDAGLTYSMFSNGPMYFYTHNPNLPLFEKTLQASVEDGDGLGFYIGATADFPVSDMAGIVVKLNYHTRVGTFDWTGKVDSMFVPEIDDFENIWFNDQVDWSFQYIGIDLMARFQLLEESLYLLAGPSFGFLTGNSMELTQSILRPADIYYREDDGTTDNMLTTASSDGEVEGFEDLRVDIKFGLGTWIEISDGLYLTPELMMTYPLTSIVKTDFASDIPIIIPEGGAAINSKLINANPNFLTFKDSNTEWNMITIFFTVGLRWQID